MIEPLRISFDVDCAPEHAFAAFQEGIADRCVEQPAPSEATIIGSYGF